MIAAILVPVLVEGSLFKKETLRGVMIFFSPLEVNESLVWVGGLWSIRGGGSHDECWLCYFMLSGPCGYNDCCLFRQIAQKREQRDKMVMTFCGWPILHSLCLMTFLLVCRKEMKENASEAFNRKLLLLTKTVNFGTILTFIIQTLAIRVFRNAV